ncbi:dihydroorotate dehydrogenase electron transfer subunit, partial [Chloroflexota bacterium]
MANQPTTENATICPVVESQEITPWAHLLWLEAPAIARQAKPGQFVMVYCGPDTTLRRPLSLHRIDRENGCIGLLFNPVGKGTKWLAAQEAGEKVEVMGPLGNGYQINPESKKVLLVSGKIGIAPLH